MNTLAMHSLTQSIRTVHKRGIHWLYQRFIAPRSTTEDDRRHEFILNIILSASVIATGLLDIFLIISWAVHKENYGGISVIIFTLIVAVFASLLILSRKRYFTLASYILIALYFTSTTYGIYQWSFLLPTTLLGYVITIIIASILISTRAGLVTTGVVMATILTITYLQTTGMLPVALYWQNQQLYLKDALQPSILLLFIMVISWLSNREIEHSLIRARKSEQTLLEERDLLEIKVEERTTKLKQMQTEKVAQLDRFAEFGRLSSGLFHDLMNPLTAVVANVSEMNRAPENLPAVQSHIERAVAASKRMGALLETVRKQFRTDHLEQMFSLNKEIEEAIDILQYRARETHVSFDLRMNEDIHTYGNPLKFHQVVLNLIANAIDASSGTTVLVTLEKKHDVVVFSVSDKGKGIDASIIDKIFDPFFTTKNEKGLGIGLSTTKDIVEKNFGGAIAVISNIGQGALFTVTFPLKVI